jgi:alkylhydroperoxidase/carboxymuconolactone decarboxylase family protein YurZ
LRSSQVTSRFGMNSGLTQGEVAEAIAHLAFEVG